MARSRVRGFFVWTLALGFLAVLLLPGLFLIWVTKRAEEGTLPLPEFLKPPSAHPDRVPSDRSAPKPGPEEKVIARVLDSRGSPLSQVPTLLFFVRSTGEGPQEWSHHVRTNETGWATFSNLPTRFTGGFVEATPARGWPVRQSFSFDGSWPCRVELVVPDGSGLCVIVRDESGAFLDDVEVRAVLLRRPGREEPLYGRETKERNGWQRRMKEILRDPDGVERWVDGWTSMTDAGAEEGMVIAGRSKGGGEFDFPRIHPEASIQVLAWGEGRAVTCLAGPRVGGGDGEVRVDLTLRRAAALQGPIVELPDKTPASGRTVRLLPPGVPTWLNIGMPAWRTDERGQLTGPAIAGDGERVVVLETPDTGFDGVTRYLDASGTWRPGTEGPLRMERDVPPLFRSTTPQPR